MRATASRILVGLALGLSAGALPAGQPQRPSTFRAGVDVVQVDVSVLDRENRPVRGLAPADFIVRENGRAREVVAFAAIDVPASEMPTAPWLRDVVPDVRSNDLGDGRLFAIILDDATLPPDLRITTDARRVARRVVEALGPADLAAVIFVMDSRRSVDFTNNRTRLLDAIDGLVPSFAYSDQSGATERYLHYASIRTLGRVAAGLSAVPLRRKAIVYVSVGVPVDVERAAAVTLVGPAPGAPPLGQPVEGSALEVDTDRDLVDAMNEALSTRPQQAYGLAVRDAFIRAQHGNVNIYSVDPGGLGGLQNFLQTHVRTGVAGPLQTPLEATQTARLQRDFLQTVAENSGGRAFVNLNDLDRGISQIFLENSSYYLLGYRSSADPADRTIRRVAVHVNRPGLTTRTRNAYFRAETAVAPTAPVHARLRGALAGLVSNPDVALEATAAAFARPGRSDAAIAVILGVRQPGTVGDVGAKVQDTISLLTSAFTPNGEPRGSWRQTARLVLRSGVAPFVHFDVLSRLDLQPGRFQLRLAADSALLGKSGSVFYDIDVPDFDASALSLSGLVLTSDPGVVAAPEDALADVLPVIPTSQRRFSPDDLVTAFLQIYQRRRVRGAVTVTSRIVDASDVELVRSEETMGLERFSTSGAGDYRFSVPISRLEAGRYLLSIAATVGARTQERAVTFEVGSRK